MKNGPIKSKPLFVLDYINIKKLSVKQILYIWSKFDTYEKIRALKEKHVSEARTKSFFIEGILFGLITSVSIGLLTSSSSKDSLPEPIIIVIVAGFFSLLGVILFFIMKESLSSYKKANSIQKFLNVYERKELGENLKRMNS